MPNVKIELSYNQNGFHMNQWTILFDEHITEETLKADIQQIKRLVRNGLKTDNVMIDVMEHEYNGTISKIRYCLNHWVEDNGHFTLEYRPFNGFDFSEKTLYTFYGQSQMVTFLGKSIKEHVRKIIPEIPEKISKYASSI